MNYQGKELPGHMVRDVITGFAGTVTGVVIYISGCNQALVVPMVNNDGKIPDSIWFDVQRLSIVDKYTQIVLDNSKTPGCDMAPPIR